MREIVHVQVGGCGNLIGTQFLELISQEHCIDLTGSCLRGSDLTLKGINVYFRETTEGRYTPRAVLTDLGPIAMDEIRASLFGHLLRPSTFISGKYGAGSNWAKGFYTEGAEMIDSVMEVIRREAEDCDALQGFQIVHSLGGGTGSGMGSLILAKCKEEFPDRINQTFSVFPSTLVSDLFVEPYNTVLSIHQLLEHADSVLVLDNEAICNTFFRNTTISTSAYQTINYVIATGMSGTTGAFRFPGGANTDLKKMTVNLVPFPNLRFLGITTIPVRSYGSCQYYHFSAQELIQQMFENRGLTISCDPCHGRYLAAAANFRGNIQFSQVETELNAAKDKLSDRFIAWLPDNLKVSMSAIPLRKEYSAVSLVSNSTASQEMFKRVHREFSALFSRRAIFHRYTGEGVDEMEFVEAECNLMDLVSEYQQHEDCGSRCEGEELELT